MKNIYPKEQINKLKKIINLFIINSTIREKKYFYIFLFLGLFGAFVEVMQVSFLIKFINVIGITSDSNINYFDSTKFITTQLLIFSFLVFISRSSINYMGGVISAETSTRFTSRILYLYSYQFFEKSKLFTSNDLNKSFASSRIISQGIIRPFLEFSSSIFLAISVVTGLLLEDFAISISLITLIGLFYLLIYRFSNYFASKYTNIIGEETRIQYQNLDKVTNSLPLLKIEGNLFRIIQNTKESIRKSRILESRCSNLSSIPRFLLEFLTIFIVGVSIIIFDIDNNSSLNFIAFAFVASQKIMPLFQIAYRSIIDIKGNLFSLDLIILSKIKSNIDLDLLNKKNNHNKYNIEFEDQNKNYSALEFCNVSYKFDLEKVYKKGKLINPFKLGPFNLLLDSNKSYSIIGPSGAGKTTFVELLLGLRKPDNGNIKFIPNISKGIEKLPQNEKIDIESIMSQIFSYVPQKPFFFSGSILENLTYPTFINSQYKNFSEEKIFKALEIVSMDIFFKKYGLNYQIGDDGNGLSTGQLQRLGIARALISDKRFIILDECTSNLDTKTENKIIRNLNSLRKKCIIHITHKKSVYMKTDKIIKLKNGIPQFVKVKEINPEFDLDN